jgi:hypothetical protein
LQNTFNAVIDFLEKQEISGILVGKIEKGDKQCTMMISRTFDFSRNDAIESLVAGTNLTSQEPDESRATRN